MKRTLFPTALAVLLLCAATPAFADTDMDGFEPPFDCNDGNNTIFPGATEVVANNVDENCDGQELCYADADNDGARSLATTVSGDLDCSDAFEGQASDPLDCSDGNPAIRPGAIEVVDNGTDDDCDGGDLCYNDADDDGARSTSTVASSDTDCVDAHEGRTADPIDCDDGDAGIFPGGMEVCDTNDVDEDCDGDADDQDPDVSAASKMTWYADGDDDGFGDAASSLSRCDQPVGYVLDDTDCDDTESSAFPGGLEVCDTNDVDEDCDGDVDDQDPDVSAASRTTWYADGDDDGFGDAGTSLSRCNQPVGYVIDDEDCDDTNDAIRPGGTETCDTGDPNDYNCDGAVACDDSTCSTDPDCIGTVEVFDHFECFKIKTTEKLGATLDLDPGTAPPFQVAEGCTIGKARKFCVPVKKTVAAIDASTTITENPLYEGPSLETMNICYKVKCPVDSPPVTGTPTIEVKDRFGNRDFQKFKVAELCTPAEIVP